MAVIIEKKSTKPSSQIIICFDKGKKSEVVEKMIKDELLKGKTKDMITLSRLVTKAVVYDTYLCIEESSTNDEIRVAIAAAVREMAKNKQKEYVVVFDDEKCKEELYERVLPLISETVDLITYRFEGYKSEPPKESPDVTVSVRSPLAKAQTTSLLKYGANIAMGTCRARSLIHMPADILNPTSFGVICEEYAKEFGMEFTRINEAELTEQGWGGLLAVGRGGLNRPECVVLKYQGAGEKDPYTALVGKGVTFDAGGYNIKANGGIVQMKVDMGGAAATLGAICSLAANKSKSNVMAIMPLCENLIGKNAFLPGVVLTMLSKKTVEITNTDAEGRLILADALSYAAKMDNVDRIVDIATLTGACALALGDAAAGVMTNDEEFLQELKDAGKATGEEVWQLPLFPKYKERMVSKIADLVNSSALKSAGAMTAGSFLKEFVDKKSWIHIDIAGVGGSITDSKYAPMGPTGFGSRLMYELCYSKIINRKKKGKKV